jgi:hypothetical protein
MTPREKRELEDAADAANLTVSTYIRHLVKEAPDAKAASDESILDEFIHSGAISIDSEALTPVAEVHDQLREFCEAEGYDVPSKNLLTRRLTDTLGVQRDRGYVDGRQQRCLSGVAVPE